MKKEAIKAVLFDLDGTLLYTLGDIKASVDVTLVNRGLHKITINECREVVGHGLRNAIISCMQKRDYQADDEELDQALIELQDYYRKNPTKYCKPYEKINTFLSKISIPFGILSNKDDKIVKQILPVVFKGIDFDYVSGAKDNILKPSPDRIYEFCNQIGISPREMLYVGDSEVDYNTAINANSQVALVTWGYRDKEELLKFNALTVDTVDQLWRIIDGN